MTVTMLQSVCFLRKLVAFILSLLESTHRLSNNKYRAIRDITSAGCVPAWVVPDRLRQCGVPMEVICSEALQRLIRRHNENCSNVKFNDWRHSVLNELRVRMISLEALQQPPLTTTPPIPSSKSVTQDSPEIPRFSDEPVDVNEDQDDEAPCEDREELQHTTAVQANICTTSPHPAAYKSLALNASSNAIIKQQLNKLELAAKSARAQAKGQTPRKTGSSGVTPRTPEVSVFTKSYINDVLGVAELWKKKKDVTAKRFVVDARH